MGGMPDMLPYLAGAAREAREAAGRKTVHIAASANVDQSTVARFEKGRAWPHNPDVLIRGYALDLGIKPCDLWKRALTAWCE